MENFGKILEVNRNRLGISQEELGEKVGVAGSTIGSYEQSRIFPSLVIFDKLCEVLQVSPEIFLEYKNPATYTNPTLVAHQPKINVIPLYNHIAIINNQLYGEINDYLKLSNNNVDFALIVNDNSMANKIKANDIVFIKSVPSLKNIDVALYVDHIVIVIHNSKTLIRKLIIKNNSYYMKASNTNYGDIKLSDNSIIVGTLISILKNEI